MCAVNGNSPEHSALLDSELCVCNTRYECHYVEGGVQNRKKN